MISLEDLNQDFEFVRPRTLYIRLADRYYDVELNYRPFRNETDFIKSIDEIPDTVQLMVISSPDLTGKMYMNANVFRFNGESCCFNMQTLNIALNRVYPIDTSGYCRVFPMENERKQITHSNIKRMSYSIKDFRYLYPS